MAKILIESRTVVFGQEHLYLVFVDDSNNEFVIRGGPESDIPPFFGNIVVEVRVPIENSEDDREGLPPANFGSREVNLNGRAAEDVWMIMLQQIQNIGNANLNYDAFVDPQNSNSVIASVLNSVGIDLTANIPFNTNLGDLPGADNLLDFNTVLAGTSADDIIRGNTGNDTLSGNDGDDTLTLDRSFAERW